MLQELRLTMLAQAETKSKAPFGNRNGRTDKSYGLDPQFTTESATEGIQDASDR